MVGILAGVTEEYRKEFRSAPFVGILCGWLFANCVVVVSILASLGGLPDTNSVWRNDLFFT